MRVNWGLFFAGLLAMALALALSFAVRIARKDAILRAIQGSTPTPRPSATMFVLPDDGSDRFRVRPDPAD